LTDLPLVAVPGGRVEYLDVPGDADRAPLLFLHEGLGSVRLWRGWPAAVAAATGRRVVAYSRLGLSRVIGMIRESVDSDDALALFAEDARAAIRLFRRTAPR